jgi:hypothetical protein
MKTDNYHAKISDLEPLPVTLKQEIIEFVISQLSDKVPFTRVYPSVYKFNNNEDLANFGGEKIEVNSEKVSSTVGFYVLPDELAERIKFFFTNLNHPDIRFTNYSFVQVVCYGSHVAPHMDSPNDRGPGWLYIIKSGGDQVKTVFYEIKDEHKNVVLKETDYNTIIPFEKIYPVYETIMEEDTWNYYNFNKIHSAQNQESLRIMLYPKP